MLLARGSLIVVESSPDSLQDGDGKITYAELQQVLEDDELLTEVPQFRWPEPKLLS